MARTTPYERVTFADKYPLWMNMWNSGAKRRAVCGQPVHCPVENQYIVTNFMPLTSVFYENALCAETCLQ